MEFKHDRLSPNCGNDLKQLVKDSQGEKLVKLIWSQGSLALSSIISVSGEAARSPQNGEKEENTSHKDPLVAFNCQQPI